MRVLYLSLLVLLGINSDFQSEVCNCCHDLVQKPMSYNDAALFLLKETIGEFIFGTCIKMCR